MTTTTTTQQSEYVPSAADYALIVGRALDDARYLVRTVETQQLTRASGLSQSDRELLRLLAESARSAGALLDQAALAEPDQS